MLTSILASQMELAILAIILVLLYSFRYAIGTAPTYIAAGLYFIFAMLVGSSRLAPTTEAANSLTLYNGLLWLPFVLLLIIIYELEGTGAAQRFYLGLFFTALLFVLLFLLLFIQPVENAHSAMADFFKAARALMTTPDSRNELLYGVFTHLFLFLLVPIIYQAVINHSKIYGIGVFISMVIYTVLVEAFGAIYIFIVAGSKAFTPTSPAGWLMRIGASIVLASLGHLFIVINTPYQKRARKALKFLTSFIDFFFSPERMMRSLSEWSERYRVVVENSSDLILLVNLEGKILNANRIAAKYLGRIITDAGFKLDQVLFDDMARPWSWRAHVPEDTDEHETQVRKKVYHCQSLTLRVPGKKTVELDLNLSHAQLDGQPIAVIIGRDVTAQREEERQRKSQQEQRMHSQRLESLGELAGGIAHDFNNLLQSIQISAEALHRKTANAPEIAHLVGNIEEGCQRAGVLTSQLLGFARKGKFHAEEIDASTLLDHAMHFFQPVAKGLVCRKVCEPVPMPIFVDENQLVQVLLNMLINSRDALRDQPEPRKITLRAEAAREEMPEWEFRPNRKARATDYICIHVRDNGAGMPESIRAKIFEPFFTTKPAGQGTGMGLPMAFGCIANHNGWLHVSSAPGEGCDITIFLPKAKPTDNPTGSQTA